jgi:hypothetical protein
VFFGVTAALSFTLLGSDEDKWIDAWMDAWMHRCMNRLMHGWMDGWRVVGDLYGLALF